MEYYYQNIESDFIRQITFYDKDQNKIAIPSFDFKLIFRTLSGGETYIAGRVNGILVRCFQEDDYTLNVLFEDHKLGTGELFMKMQTDIDNSLFKKGYQHYVSPRRTGVIMTYDRSSGDGKSESAAVWEYMHGASAYELAVKYGYEGTEEEFAKLQTETADELRRFEEETAANFGNQQKYIDTNIAVERSDRESGDASTLQAAKSYTDATAASERVVSDAADRQTLVDAKAYVDAAIEQLVNGSPAALDTLKELSDALGNDPNFATTITNALAGKVDKIAGMGLSAEDFTTEQKAKLAAIDEHANNYTHPSAHPASMIQEDATRRFVSDSEKTSWNNAVAQLGDIATALDKING